MHRVVNLALGAVAVVLIIGVVAPGLAPITMTTPVSDSMTPTAPQHSLVIAVDQEPKQGDIALFRSPDRSAPVLHRLIGQTESGDYLTKGDANDVADQEVGMNPVSPNAIYGTVPTIAGQPLIIPYAGMIFTNPVVMIGAWGLLALSLLYTTEVGKITRGAVQSVPIHQYGYAVAIIIMIAVPIATIAFPVALSTEIITSTTVSDESPNVAAPGETSERTATVSSPFLTVLQTSVHVDGDLIIEDTETGIGKDTTTVTLRNEPSDEPTAHRSTITIYSYPGVLPGFVVHPLAEIHPVIPASLSGVILAAPVAILSRMFDKHKIIRAAPTTLRKDRKHRKRP